MTICHLEKFLHMTDFFSTSTAGGAGDKYQVCLKVYSLADLEQFSASALNQRVVGSSSEHEASSR